VRPAVGFRRQGRGFTAGGAGRLTATVMPTDDGGEQEAEAAAELPALIRRPAAAAELPALGRPADKRHKSKARPGQCIGMYTKRRVGWLMRWVG
jgi:hypothetical protein